MRDVAIELARFSRRNTLSAIGGLIGLVIVFAAVGAPFLAPRDPLKADFRRMNKPPDAQSLLGTDQVGRDTLSRVIYGARTSLFVAFSAVILGTTVGSLWGVACGYLRGRFDLVSQRIMGHDPLRLRLDPGAPTYWNDRRPPGPEPGTMPRQF